MHGAVRMHVNCGLVRPELPYHNIIYTYGLDLGRCKLMYFYSLPPRRHVFALPKK